MEDDVLGEDKVEDAVVEDDGKGWVKDNDFEKEEDKGDENGNVEEEDDKDDNSFSGRAGGGGGGWSMTMLRMMMPRGEKKILLTMKMRSQER